MNSKIYIPVLFFLLFFAGCITQFIPETDEIQQLIVVEGLITDQDEVNTIKLSKSMPLGKKNIRNPLKGCSVLISDDMGITHWLTETGPGIYTTTKGAFRGTVGRKYTLIIHTNNATANHFSYQSVPMEMKPVPPIDSLYYEKVMIEQNAQVNLSKEGCQVYLDTYDPSGQCNFYRWEYSETWEIRIPFSVPVNNTCWITNNSSVINIKNVSGLAETKVKRYPIRFVSNETDKLRVKYSMNISQYSLSDDEFSYWEKLQNISQDVGSLYDITPSSVPGNIYCLEDPGETVLGFFSVSAKSSKRIFIKDRFYGIVNPYSGCISDTIFGNGSVPGLNTLAWILEQNLFASPPFTVITENRGCADCTVRGSITKPDFWDSGN